MTALAAYESGLRIGSGCWLNDDDGARVELPLRRWLDPADDCDRLVLDRCDGPTLDVGCGPGRLTVALMDRGVDAVGVDISREAVRMARARGAHALRRAGGLIRRGGSVWVAVEPPGSGFRRRTIQVEAHGHRGSMPRAHVGVDVAEMIAARSKFAVRDVICTSEGRYFVELTGLSRSLERQSL